MYLKKCSQVVTIINWYLFQNMLTVQFIIGAAYFKALPCLFEVVMDWLTGLFTSWAQSSACQHAKSLHMMYYSMDFLCYIYSQV